jgi:hypothetical protein
MVNTQMETPPLLTSLERLNLRRVACAICAVGIIGEMQGIRSSAWKPRAKKNARKKSKGGTGAPPLVEGYLSLRRAPSG